LGHDPICRGSAVHLAACANRSGGGEKPTGDVPEYSKKKRGGGNLRDAKFEARKEGSKESPEKIRRGREGLISFFPPGDTSGFAKKMEGGPSIQIGPHVMGSWGARVGRGRRRLLKSLLIFRGKQDAVMSRKSTKREVSNDSGGPGAGRGVNTVKGRPLRKQEVSRGKKGAKRGFHLKIHGASEAHQMSGDRGGTGGASISRKFRRREGRSRLCFGRGKRFGGRLTKVSSISREDLHRTKGAETARKSTTGNKRIREIGRTGRRKFGDGTSSRAVTSSSFESVLCEETLQKGRLF